MTAVRIIANPYIDEVLLCDDKNIIIEQEDRSHYCYIKGKITCGNEWLYGKLTFDEPQVRGEDSAPRPNFVIYSKNRFIHLNNDKNSADITAILDMNIKKLIVVSRWYNSSPYFSPDEGAQERGDLIISSDGIYLTNYLDDEGIIYSQFIQKSTDYPKDLHNLDYSSMDTYLTISKTYLDKYIKFHHNEDINHINIHKMLREMDRLIKAGTPVTYQFTERYVLFNILDMMNYFPVVISRLISEYI